MLPAARRSKTARVFLCCRLPVCCGVGVAGTILAPSTHASLNAVALIGELDCTGVTRPTRLDGPFAPQNQPISFCDG